MDPVVFSRVRFLPSTALELPALKHRIYSRVKYNTFKSPIEVQQLHDLREPIDWPIVRLDNVRAPFSFVHNCDTLILIIESKDPLGRHGRPDRGLASQGLPCARRQVRPRRARPLQPVHLFPLFTTVKNLILPHDATAPTEGP